MSFWPCALLFFVFPSGIRIVIADAVPMSMLDIALERQYPESAGSSMPGAVAFGELMDLCETL
jgi:hypothetical protein